MRQNKSFQDILEEKIEKRRNQKDEILSTNSSYSTVNDWQWRIQAKRPAFTPTEIPSAYPASGKTIVTVTWSEAQQSYLKILIELGAEIRLDSPYEEIKRAYRELLKKYHPDHWQSSDEFTQKRYGRLLQKVVAAFRSFDNSELRAA